MQHLTGLKELELLNLYGTAVGDSGLESFGSTYQTQVAFRFRNEGVAAGIAKLQKAIARP